ncbi:hypothetical protein [Amedibacterium intestinale]|nr:hypothetical protein [Amedibacterium intestinale]
MKKTIKRPSSSRIAYFFLAKYIAAPAAAIVVMMVTIPIVIHVVFDFSIL